jgi:hypothetical protein
LRRLGTLVLMLASAAFAQTLVDAPSAIKKPGHENVYLSPFKDPSFYAGVGIFSASAIYDVHSTRACEKTITCVEAYKGHDRYGYIAPQIAIVIAGEYGCFLMLHDHKWWRRTVCPGIAIAFSIQHWKDGSTIYKNDPIARP